MNKSTKIIIWLVLIALVIWGLSGLNKKTSVTPATGEAVKIGAILPLTGDFAIVGEEIKRGAEIALAELGNKVDFDVLYEDDASFTPRLSASAATKLINIDKVSAIMTAAIEEAKPIVPIVNTAGIPLLITWDSNEFIKVAGPNVYSIGFSTEKNGEKIADYAFSKLNLKRISILGHKDAWAEIITPAFKNKFESLGGQIIYDEVVNADTTDYRTEITKIKQLNPDGVYFPMIPPQNARFLIQAKQLGLKATLLTGDPLIQDVINEAADAAEGVYFTNNYSDKAEILETKYREMFKTDPADIPLVSFGYDGIMKIAEASKLSDNLVEGFKKLFGNSHSTERIQKLFKVVNGQPVGINY